MRSIWLDNNRSITVSEPSRGRGDAKHSTWVTRVRGVLRRFPHPVLWSCSSKEAVPHVDQRNTRDARPDRQQCRRRIHTQLEEPSATARHEIRHLGFRSLSCLSTICQPMSTLNQVVVYKLVDYNDPCSGVGGGGVEMLNQTVCCVFVCFCVCVFGVWFLW
jgi:hypothetical protein